MGKIDEMAVGKVKAILPYIIGPTDTITGMRYDQTVQEVIVTLERHIKAAANKRANYGLHLSISPGNGLTDIPFYPEGDKSSRSYYFKGSKSTQIA